MRNSKTQITNYNLETGIKASSLCLRSLFLDTNDEVYVIFKVRLYRRVPLEIKQ